MKKNFFTLFLPKLKTEELESKTRVCDVPTATTSPKYPKAENSEGKIELKNPSPHCPN